ncbi:trehalose-6-phosphate synthase [Niveibacterium sp. SC-1]|uniref:alpha,alpha-trehalose-phosphate synthase (UDP-forming) n=1 Tax=Niveibacterium sp. SC-1 TaxID=3135646 RepID=UPI00311FF051
MNLSARFILPLFAVLALVAYLAVPVVDRLALSWSRHDLDVRASLVARTLNERFSHQEDFDAPQLRRQLESITEDERLRAIAFCPDDGGKAIATHSFNETLSCERVAHQAEGRGSTIEGEGGLLHVAVFTLHDGPRSGRLVLIHDMSFAERRTSETRKYLFLSLLGLGAVIALVTVVVAHLSLRGWLRGLRELLREPQKPVSPELRPLARDLHAAVREILREQQTGNDAQTQWTAASLREILRRDLRGDEVIVVSNREPYVHEYEGDQIVVRRPAGGLVTALEPIMRACSGTWIAHGSGDADKAAVDSRDRVAVPPNKPSYAIRRIWLSAEEERGYYNGLSNEGLWPLCHIAHARPTFRSQDWELYKAVNARFADAVVQEAQRDDPIVMVQDYHFALLPRMIRERLPKATIVTFWHIPWPNPETFSICPWRAEIIDGLLGSSILGFHTQFHCNNFLDAVDSFLEARVDRETGTVFHQGHQADVKRYPISIAWPPEYEAPPAPESRAGVRQELGLPPEQRVGVGVDRLDYTKGIIERFLAIERLFELHPEWAGRFSFVQIAAPTRSAIPQYKAFRDDVEELAARINGRFTREGPPAIILRTKHHDGDEIARFYRAADLCMVTSLHDGMNLVAKEFVAARDDGMGVLILSQFTGASRELSEALIVNPYHIDQCADALAAALTMPDAEQRDRMRLMRELVAQFNVYRWAGRMLLDASAMRLRDRIAERVEFRRDAY